MPDKNPDYTFTSDEYKQKINSPATSPVYFEHFIKPLVDEALASASGPDRKVRIIDMACGHAQAMEFMAAHPQQDRLMITGLDLSAEALKEARANFASKYPKLDIYFIRADAENDLPLPPESADMGTAINAMAYKQAHMLKSLYNALKSGGECVINFFLPAKNKDYIDFYQNLGCKVYERELQVEANGQTRAFKLLVTDFSGFEDPKISQLGQQSFLQSTQDIADLARLLGFEIVKKCAFEFFSPPIKAIVNNQVYTFRKPEKKNELDEGRLEVSEKVTDLLG